MIKFFITDIKIYNIYQKVSDKPKSYFTFERRQWGKNLASLLAIPPFFAALWNCYTQRVQLSKDNRPCYSWRCATISTRKSTQSDRPDTSPSSGWKISAITDQSQRTAWRYQDLIFIAIVAAANNWVTQKSALKNTSTASTSNNP